MTDMFCYCSKIDGWDPDTVVKAACLESRKSRVRPALAFECQRNKKCIFPAHSIQYNCGEPP